MAENFDFKAAEDELGATWAGLEEEFRKLEAGRFIKVNGYKVPVELGPLLWEEGLRPEQVCAIADLVDSAEDYREVMTGYREFLRGERQLEDEYDQRANDISLRLLRLDSTQEPTP